MSAEYERTPRKIGGRFLNNIPGLTAERLGELWRAIQGICGNEAIGNVTYGAHGGMGIEISWQQIGMRQTYNAKLTAEDVASVVDVDEDTLFRNFATMTLDSVRRMVNQLNDAKLPEGEVDTAPTFQGTKEATDILIGTLRAARVGDPPARAVKVCAVCGKACDAELGPDECPRDGVACPWAGNVATGDIEWGFNGDRWERTGKRVPQEDWQGASHALLAHDFEHEGVVRRVWMPKGGGLVLGQLAYESQTPPETASPEGDA